MTYTRREAVARALRSTTYPVGMCYRWTREMFGMPAVGDRDGDGDADAVDGWKAATRKHPGDRKPPGGVPVFWSGGSKGHGHAAITTLDGRVRSIDTGAGGFGTVGTVDLGWFERHWGLKYLGWAEDLGGVTIPHPEDQPRTLKLSVATINVPGSVGPKAWERCFELLMAHGTDFAGANEIGRPAAKRLLSRIAKANRREQFGAFRGPNPVVSNPARWKRTGGRVWRLHAAGASALARKWVGFNGARYATVTTNRPVKAPYTPEVAAIQTHWVPRGKKVPEWWRKRQRERARTIVERLVRTHRARGRIVLVMGDLNMEKAPHITGVTWVHDTGVDKIGVACPADVKLTARKSAFFDAPTDHKHGVHADLTFTIGARR